MSSELDRITETLTEDPNEWIRVVASLIQFTEEGKLKWKSALPAESLKSDPESRIEAVYLTEYKNKKIRLYVEVIKVDDPDPFFNISFFKRKYPYYDREIVFQIGDKSEYGWYRVTDVDQYTLESLLESIKYKVLGIEGFLADTQNDTESVS